MRSSDIYPLMALNPPKQSDTSVDVGRRRRTNAPREKRGGISLPVHLWKAIDDIVELQTLAYGKMGGETKASVSDELEVAVEAHIRDFMKKHGQLPLTDKERNHYVERLAESHTKSLRDDLLDE